MILSKALMKFFYFKFKLLNLKKENEELQTYLNLLYNGDIVNSLSGMFALKYSLDQNEEFNWEYLKMIMAPNNFEENNFKVILTKTDSKTYRHKTRNRMMS